MTSVRHRLEQQLWAAGVRVGVLPSDTDSPQLQSFPVFLPSDVSANDVERVLAEVAGRLGFPALRVSWRADGLLSLQVPKEKPETVSLNQIKSNSKATLPWLCGITIDGQVLTADVATMPHLLIAGVTGAGKSNGMNAALCHLATTRSPKDVVFLLLDPKRVDLVAFADIPHTLEHVTDADAMATALEALVDEMARRYKLLEQYRVKDLEGFHAAGGQLPRIVCVIDEWGMLADTHGKRLEPSLLALLQTARAAGIHIILGIQRPDNDTLRPRLRNNLPARQCFRVGDANSSRLILNTDGAEGLLGRGDGLYRDSAGVFVRFQSPYVDPATLQQKIKQAKQFPASTFTLSDYAKPPEIDPTLSRYEQAVSLSRRLQWVRSQDLVDAEIVNSQAVGRQVISELEQHGILGAYDPSQKARPVIKPASCSGSVAGKKHVTDANNGYNGLLAKAGD